MRDIRLKTETLELDGRTWTLACNNNVLADAQDAYGGNFSAAFRGSTIKSVLTFGALMLNECADERGWPERYTWRELGRKLSPAELNRFAEKVMPLVEAALDSLGGDQAEQTTETSPMGEEPGEKNA